VHGYEAMVVFDPTTDDARMRTLLDRMSELIRSNGGTVVDIEHLGKRQLAYEVRHRSEGRYVLVRFEGAGALPGTVDRQLRLADELLRHKVIRVPDNVWARQRSAARGSGPERAAGPGSAVQAMSSAAPPRSGTSASSARDAAQTASGATASGALQQREALQQPEVAPAAQDAAAPTKPTNEPGEPGAPVIEERGDRADGPDAAT
jgi:small subunit ribosomal protein S6